MKIVYSKISDVDRIVEQRKKKIIEISTELNELLKKSVKKKPKNKSNATH